MSLRGTFAGPKGYAETASGWKVFADDVSGPDMDSLSKLLSESPKTHDELIERDDLPSWPFALFLASRDPRTVLLSKHDSSGRAMAHGLGLYDRYAASLCLIGFLADNEGRNRGIFSFGSPGMTLALGSHVDSWRRMGSPRIDDLTITAYPTDSGEEHPGDLVIRHRYGLSFSWNPDPSESPSP